MAFLSVLLRLNEESMLFLLAPCALRLVTFFHLYAITLTKADYTCDAIKNALRMAN